MSQIQFKMVVAIILVCVVAGASYSSYLSVTPTVVHSEDDPETEILKSLYCLCGECHGIACDCPMSCTVVQNIWKPRIEKELQAGMTKEQIINGFVEEYGEKVLVKPSKPLEFPVWIWIIPIAFLVGAVIIYQYVRRRHRVRG
jgi:cytochrome c-type biogenesis protein CcmH/NrfF